MYSVLQRVSQQCMRRVNVRCMSSSKKMTIEDVNELFAEARMSLQDAVESKGTVYFEDDFKDAQQMTKQTLQAFHTLCSSVDDKQRQSLIEANRPKMAQLEQEFNNLQDELIHDDDH